MGVGGLIPAGGYRGGAATQYRDPFAPVQLGSAVTPMDSGVTQVGSPVTQQAGSGSYASSYAPTSGPAPINFTLPQYKPVEYNVTPLSVNTQRDPGIEQTYGDVKRYKDSLAAGTDQDAVNAIMRQRDTVSGLAKEVGQERALATGGAGSGAANQAVTDVYTQGGRDVSNLNASLAAGGRSAQLAALGEQGNVAQASAADLAQKNNFALNTWQAQAAAEAARVESINAAQQSQWNANLQLAALAFTG